MKDAAGRVQDATGKVIDKWTGWMRDAAGRVQDATGRVLDATPLSFDHTSDETW